MLFVRKYFPVGLILLLAGAFAWAVSFGTPERADFVFNNMTEVQTLDPTQASGQPEHRVCDALFEGLCREIPSDDPGLDGFLVIADPPSPGERPRSDGEASRVAELNAETPGDDPRRRSDARRQVDLVPGPGMAERVEVSSDGLTYTFHLRADAKWSDGTPFTSADMLFSWWRILHPETIERYAFLLYTVDGAEAYASGQLTPGGPVEVELADRLRPLDNVPRGTIVRGTLTAIHRDETAESVAVRLGEFADQPSWEAFLAASPETLSAVERRVRETYRHNRLERAQALAREAADDAAVMVVEHPAEVEVEVGRGSDATPESVRARTAGRTVAWTRDPARAAAHYDGPTTVCQRVMPDFGATVAMRAVDPRTFEVTLASQTPYFLSLVSFYTLYPTPRHVIEEFGLTDWTRDEHIVSNGPYRLLSRRLRDRIRLTRNEQYWDRDRVAIERIDVVAVETATTALNMYLKGDVDWIPTVPANLVERLKDRPDFYSAPVLTVYFYRLNCNREPTNDPRVRRALSLAVDRAVICETITRAGERPATHLVPPGMAGYTSPTGRGEDLSEARRLIDEVRAEYAAKGQALPAVEIMYNTEETHKMIAEAIMQQWSLNLGISVRLRNMEWASYLAAMHNKDYSVCRAGWVGDYNDPSTFLDMWVTDGSNNETGWSNPRYDELIAAAQRENDPEARMRTLADAEAILLDGQPIIPVYFYMSKNLVNPRVEGFSATLQDVHPLQWLSTKGPPAPPAQAIRPAGS